MRVINEDLCADDSDGMELDTGHFINCKSVKYVVVDKIGRGGYGAVYKVVRDPPQTPEKVYAMKVERKMDRREHSKLNMEVHLLKLMQTRVPDMTVNHFVKIFDKTKKDKFFMIVMTLLGESLAQLKRLRNPPVFSPATGFRVGTQCLEAIEQLHKVGFIHRDIKPANFAVGKPPRSHIIYILDFGIARRYVNEDNDVKAPREKVRFKGTVRFASVRCHKGDELGRKDDVESWLYMLVDICNEHGLPWQRDKDKKSVLKMKLDARTSQGKIRLFEPLGVSFMESIMTYLDKLSYADEVDYQFIYAVIGKAAEAAKATVNDPFDWERTRMSIDDLMISRSAPSK